MATNTYEIDQFDLSSLTNLAGRVALVTGGGTGMYVNFNCEALMGHYLFSHALLEF